MVEKFKKTIELLELDYQQKLALFAVMKMDDLVDKWSIFLAADWITESNRGEVFQKLAAIIRKTFTEEENESIARIGIFSKSDHIPQLFLQFKEETILNNQKVNGFFIHEAYILRSNSL